MIDVQKQERHVPLVSTASLQLFLKFFHQGTAVLYPGEGIEPGEQLDLPAGFLRFFDALFQSLGGHVIVGFHHEDFIEPQDLAEGENERGQPASIGGIALGQAARD